MNDLHNIINFIFKNNLSMLVLKFNFRFLVFVDIIFGSYFYFKGSFLEKNFNLI